MAPNNQHVFTRLSHQSQSNNCAFNSLLKASTNS